MKRSWIIWVLVIGVIIVGVIVFNNERTKEIPLSDLFSDEGPASVEYEFVGTEQPIKAVSVVEAELKKPVVPVVEPAVVQVEIPSKPQAAESVAQTSVASDGQIILTEGAKIPFTIQVASFKERNLAEKVLDDVKDKNYPAYIMPRDLGEKGVWYRVYIGKFETKSEAQEFLTQVKQNYPNSFIISPK